MKLETAIGFLTFLDKSTTFYFTVDDHSAIKLGIKAIERIDRLRKAGHYIGMPLLKGETTD